MKASNRYDETPLYRIMLALSWILVFELPGLTVWALLAPMHGLFVVLTLCFSVVATLAIVGIAWLLYITFCYFTVRKVKEVDIIGNYSDWLLKTFGKLKPKYKAETIANLKENSNEY